MKILVAGNGKVGETLVKQLSSEGYDITLIDSDTRVLEYELDKYDVMAVEGNCASMDTLRSADVQSADLLIATTGMDELNLLCCVTAHGMNPKLHTIARIRTPEYLEQAYSMRDTFGLSMSFNPERQAAREIERLIKYPGFLKRDSFARGQVEIVELRVDADSKLKDIALNSIHSIVKCQVLVCSVLRNGEAITPDGNFVLREGDRIFVTAPSKNLSTLLKNLGVVTKRAKKATLIGGGAVSYYLAQYLIDSRIDVTIIEENKDRCIQLASLLPKASVIHGDARDQHILDQENFDNSDAVVALTEMDELNIIVSLYARDRGVSQIITKLDKDSENRIIDNLPLGSVICPRKLCCNTIVRYVRAMKNQTGAATAIHSIADGSAEAMEFRVDASTLNCKTPLKSIKLKKNILVACISRGHETHIPNGDSSFEVGDTLLVISTANEVITQLNDIFE
ncbi:MAG: Trk system potassium transporter TrkA [Clostridia bacterium]|nr:Trk system potassium transporter TrkA [Clostridia bacterium]